MRAPAILLASAALFCLAARAATPGDQYDQADAQFSDAQKLERSGELAVALIAYDECAAQLEQLKEVKPPWNLSLVLNRLQDCHTHASLLRMRLEAQGGFPVATKPQVRSQPVVDADSPPSYPWRAHIITKVFVLGHDPAAVSLDPHWVKDNGGVDADDAMSGYASALHASTMNPFYVGLPFNDVAHPDEALRWLPRGWTSRKNEAPGSACLGRWIEIKTASGRACFAQWEAADPATAADGAYVFGPPTLPAQSGVGLFISPAVGKYLGIDDHAFVSWRFMNDDQVPPGLWLRYDEQAILFSAIHAMNTRANDAGK